MEVTPDCSADLIVTEGLAKRSWRPQSCCSCESAAARNGEATGVSEVRLDGSARKKHASHESERARRSELGVVKRQIPRSFGRGRRPTDQRRGASLEEMPGTHEARVLVVEAVGSINRSVRIGIELRGTSQGKPQKGDLARGKSLNPLTRATMTRRRVATG